MTATLRVVEWSEPIVVDVEGRPAPKGSRISGKTKSGKAYTYPASKYEEPWIKAVTAETKRIMRHHSTPEPPYAVRLDFRIHAPARKKYEWPTSADLDKLVRAVLDGLVRGGALADDRHVCALTACKKFVTADQKPGVRCEILSEQDVRTFA